MFANDVVYSEVKGEFMMGVTKAHMRRFAQNLMRMNPIWKIEEMEEEEFDHGNYFIAHDDFKTKFIVFLRCKTEYGLHYRTVEICNRKENNVCRYTVPQILSAFFHSVRDPVLNDLLCPSKAGSPKVKNKEAYERRKIKSQLEARLPSYLGSNDRFFNNDYTNDKVPEDAILLQDLYFAFSNPLNYPIPSGHFKSVYGVRIFITSFYKRLRKSDDEEFVKILESKIEGMKNNTVVVLCDDLAYGDTIA